MTDKLDGMFLKFPYQVVFLSSSPYVPSDYNCQLLGLFNFANCYLSSDKTKFYMNLYSNTTLQKNFQNHFYQLPIYYLNQPIQDFSFAANLAMPQNMIPPTVVLNQQQQYVNICEDTQIQIIQELVNGNNNLTYNKWNLESMNPPSSASAVALTQILANFEKKNYLTLPQLSLNENTNYQFSVEVVNFIGTSNKVLFNLKTLSKSTPFIKVVSPNQFSNIDFRNDFQLQISYNTTVCGSSSSPTQQNKITVTLQDGLNQVYSQGIMTDTSSQIFNLTIPSQFLQSAKQYTIVIQLSIQAQSSSYQQSISITTMNPILSSYGQSQITDFIQDNNQPILFNMNFDYIDKIKVDKAQFTLQWDCIDLFLVSNSCTKMFNPSLNQNIQGMLPNRMYQITFSMGFGSQISYITFNIVLADLSNTNQNQIYSFQNNIQSCKLQYCQNFGLIQQFPPWFKSKTLISQIVYQPFNLVVFMLNFQVIKVDIPNANDIAFRLSDLINQKNVEQLSQYNLLSIVLFNQKILHFKITYDAVNNDFNQNVIEDINCQFVLSSNYVEAFTDVVQISLKNCIQKYQIVIYTDYQKLQKDLSQQSTVNGYLTDYYLRFTDKLSLTFSNNANKQNYNQFYILGISENPDFSIISSINVIENSKITSLYSLQQIVFYILNQFNYQIERNKYLFIKYLMILQLEYIDSKSCSQKCSVNGKCQLQNVLPFSQVQSFQCQCLQNYFFYDCTASQSDIQNLYDLLSSNYTFELNRMQYNKQVLNLLALGQQFQQYIPFFNADPMFYQKIYFQSDDLKLISADFGCQDLADYAFDFLDYLIQYFKLFPNNHKFQDFQIFLNLNCKFATGSPAYYFVKHNICGIVKQVPYKLEYLSKMFTLNQIIVNQICETGELQKSAIKDISIPYYPIKSQPQYFNIEFPLALVFLKQVYSNYYQDQIKPGIMATVPFQENSQNLTLYFDIPTFYQQNKQLKQDLNFKFQKLICILGYGNYWQMCHDNQIIIQGNSSLLKCVCQLDLKYGLSIIFIDDYNYLFIFANEIFSYQQIAILGYLGLVLIIQIPLSFIGLMQDKKKKVQIGVIPIRRQSTIFDINQDLDLQQDINQHKKLERKSSILLKVNKEEIVDSKNTNFCYSLIKAHSVGKIYFNYSLNLPRFQRYMNQFLIYLSLPAVGGLYAKFQFDTLIQFNLAYFCICMSPFGLRFVMSIIDLLYYSINKYIKIKIFNYPLILIMNILYIGIYGFVGYIYYRLWTDSNSIYLQNWLVFSIIMLIFHAFIFEILYVTISIYFVRSEFQKKLQRLRKLQLKTQGKNTQIQQNDQVNLPYNKLPSNDPGNLISLETHENQLANINRQSQLVLLTKTTLLDKMQIEQIDGDLNIQGKNKVIQLQPTKSQIILKQKTLQKL
ncbi:hypothetical protein ABPG74_006953 [Tetrahymena malaccensis]